MKPEKSCGSLRLLAMAQTSAKLDGQYVLGIAQSSAHYAVHTSSPASAIYLLDKTTLARTTTRSAHAGHGTTALKTADLAGSGPQTLISAGKDGTVVVWDERTAQPAITCASPRELRSRTRLTALKYRTAAPLPACSPLTPFPRGISSQQGPHSKATTPAYSTGTLAHLPVLLLRMSKPGAHTGTHEHPARPRTPTRPRTRTISPF